jgi:Squalene-hopene cyclase C-terminal domain/Prenyltransferase and squalene oxidase repeat
VSWQLASFALVIASLGLAFWWYGRSQPSAKLLALVATLAAIAALGRDAFAAVPDVKPITAIVLVSGIAFGAGPGFAVGAISGFASNFLLGQGPWTPWQMLGWSLVGLIGAGLGRLSGRRMSPLAIALACAVAAEAFNLVVDLYTWTSTGDQTLRAFGLILGTALVFDLTHVFASFAFGLAFGPTLLRMLTRVRARLQITWEGAAGPPQGPAPSQAPSPLSVTRLGGQSLLVLLLTLPLLALEAPSGARAASGPPPGPMPAATPFAAAADHRALIRELAFLSKAQNPNGGFGAGAGETSSELYSSWVALGLAAAGRDPLSLRKDGHTVLDAIRGEASSLQGAGDLERTILALRACGVSVHSLPGGDPVRRLLRFRSHDGSFSEQANLTSFAVLALRAAGYSFHDSIVRGAAAWLQRQQEPDGGFGFGERGGGGDVDDTAAVVQALVAAGGQGGALLGHAVSFILDTQNLDGGFPEESGGESNSQSTAWAIQALSAVGRNLEGVRRKGSRTPLEYIESLVAPDGSVRYSRTGSQTPVWVTAQALTALAGKPFPIAPLRARAATPSTRDSRSTAAPRSTGVGERALANLGPALGALFAPLLAGLSGGL